MITLCVVALLFNLGAIVAMVMVIKGLNQIEKDLTDIASHKQ